MTFQVSQRRSSINRNKLFLCHAMRAANVCDEIKVKIYRMIRARDGKKSFLSRKVFSHAIKIKIEWRSFRRRHSSWQRLGNAFLELSSSGRGSFMCASAENFSNNCSECIWTWCVAKLTYLRTPGCLESNKSAFDKQTRSLFGRPRGKHSQSRIPSMMLKFDAQPRRMPMTQWMPNLLRRNQWLILMIKQGLTSPTRGTKINSCKTTWSRLLFLLSTSI